jgi:hypothetical protein
MFAFSCCCFTPEMAKENLGATWEYKYRLEIAGQKLPHYDSVECMIADNFQELTTERILSLNVPVTAIEYWLRLCRKRNWVNQNVNLAANASHV